MFATNIYWLKFNPIHVDFDIEGNGLYNISVILNKKNDDNFNKVKSENIDINLTQKEHVDVFVKKSKFPKKIRFVISNCNSANNIILSDIKIEKLQLNKLNHFKITGTESWIEGNKLILKPNGSILTLTYNDKLPVLANVNVDFKLLIIIMILTYLLAYKLTGYIVNFKTNQDKSRLDIIFLTVVFIFLFIPMSYINKDNISKQEKRTLAKWQSIIKEDNEINFEFGKNFNDWFNDRFFGRKTAINTFNLIKLGLSSKYYENKDMFYIKSNNFIGSKKLIPNADIFSEQNIDEIIKDAYTIKKYCDKKNIKFYILIVPYNITVYQDLVKPFDCPEELNKINQAIYRIQRESSVPVIYPFKELKQASLTEWVYFKTDHHWTDFGAFIGYHELMKKISKDFPDIKQLTVNDFDISEDNKIRADFSRKFYEGNQLAGVASFLKPYKDKILDTKYKYFFPKESPEILSVSDDFRQSKDSFYQKGTNYRVLEIGNSMNENIFPFIANTFKYVKYIRLNERPKRSDIENAKIMKNYGKEIEEFNPNIIIYCITYKYIFNLKYFFVED